MDINKYREYYREYTKKYRSKNLEKRKKNNDESKKLAVNHKKDWSDEEVNILIDYYNSGMKCKDIAIIMGRTYLSIDNKISKLIKEGKLIKKVRILPDEEVIKHIREKDKKCKKKINNETKKIAINNTKNWSEEEINLLINYYNSGVIYKNIAIILGRSFTSINGKIYELIKKGKLIKRGNNKYD